MPRSYESMDRALVRYQRSQSPNDLAEVFDVSAPELLRVAQHLVSDMHLAEDLVQATFIVAIQRREQFTGSGAMGWLLTILNNLALNMKRSRSKFLGTEVGEERRKELEGVVSVADPVKTAEAQELSESVAAAINQLSESYRPVLNLYLRYGMTASEIAMNLDRAPATVYKQLER